MTSEPTAQTRQANAMSEAFRNAKALTRAKAIPERVHRKPRNPLNAVVLTPEASLAELVARIKFALASGLLDLATPASDLVQIYGASDARQLTLAMTRLGFVRVHRGVGQVVFQMKSYCTDT
jgi:hypothetical protein